MNKKNTQHNIQQLMDPSVTEVIKTSLTPVQIKNRLEKFITNDTAEISKFKSFPEAFVGRIRDPKPYHGYLTGTDFYISYKNLLKSAAGLGAQYLSINGEITQSDPKVLVKITIAPYQILWNGAIFFLFQIIIVVISIYFLLFNWLKTLNSPIVYLCTGLAALLLVYMLYFMNFILKKRVAKNHINLISRILDEKNELILDEYNQIISKENYLGNIVLFVVLATIIGAALLYYYILSK